MVDHFLIIFIIKKNVCVASNATTTMTTPHINYYFYPFCIRSNPIGNLLRLILSPSPIKFFLWGNVNSEMDFGKGGKGNGYRKRVGRKIKLKKMKRKKRNCECNFCLIFFSRDFQSFLFWNSGSKELKCHLPIIALKLFLPTLTAHRPKDIQKQHKVNMY